MQAHNSTSNTTRYDDPSRTAPHGAFRHEATLRYPAFTDNQILDRLFDLFAGERTNAFGQDREWWADVITDGGHDALCLLVLPALASVPAGKELRRVQADLRDALTGSARVLLAKAFSEGREFDQ